MSNDRRSFVLALGMSAGFAAASSAAAQPSSSSSAAPRDQQRLSAAASYVAIPRLTAPVMQRSTPSGTLICESCLDVPDAALRGRVNALMPRLRDALRQGLTNYGSVHMRPGGAPDPDHIARLLQVAVDGVFGQAGARVLITDLMMQAPLR
jgi:hypothetical protein